MHVVTAMCRYCKVFAAALSLVSITITLLKSPASPATLVERRLLISNSTKSMQDDIMTTIVLHDTILGPLQDDDKRILGKAWVSGRHCFIRQF